MPLKAKITSLDDVHESVQDLYEKDGEGFKLKAPEGFVAADSVEDVSGLKSALSKERDTARTVGRENKALKDKLAGFDTDKFDALLAAEAAAETTKLQEAGEFEKIKEQMVTQHATELSAKDTEIARLTGQLENVQIDSKVVEAISKAGGNVELLKPHVRSRLQLNTDDFTTQVLEPDGKTPKVDGDGKPVTIDALVGEMRASDIYSGAFKATDQSGSGSEPGKGGDGPSGSGNGGKPIVVTGKTRADMTDREKIDFQKQHGIDKYMELPAGAVKITSLD